MTAATTTTPAVPSWTTRWTWTLADATGALVATGTVDGEMQAVAAAQTAARAHQRATEDGWTANTGLRFEHDEHGAPVWTEAYFAQDTRATTLRLYVVPAPAVADTTDDFERAITLARCTGSVAASHNGVYAVRQDDGSWVRSDRYPLAAPAQEPPADVVRVRVLVEVETSHAAWAAVYGEQRDLAADVASYVENQVAASTAVDEGAMTFVSATRA